MWLFFDRIDDICVNIERENFIESRWTPDDLQYQNAKHEVTLSNSRKQLQQIRKRIVERWFLLGLKSKYSGILTGMN